MLTAPSCDLTVDLLTQQVCVTVVAVVLFAHVDEDPVQGDVDGAAPSRGQSDQRGPNSSLHVRCSVQVHDTQSAMGAALAVAHGRPPRTFAFQLTSVCITSPNRPASMSSPPRSSCRSRKWLRCSHEVSATRQQP